MCPRLYHSQINSLQSYQTHVQTQRVLDTILSWGRKEFTPFILWTGYIEHEFILSNVTAKLEKLFNKIGEVLKQMQIPLDLIENAVI